MKESNLRKQFMPKWQQKNGALSKLFRNNTGGYAPKPGDWISFGIGLLRRKNKKSPYRPVGGGDLIGWTSKTICEVAHPDAAFNNYRHSWKCPVNGGCEGCYFDQKIAIFTSIELKTKGVPETQDQKDWKQMVLEAGGIAETVREEEE